MRKTTQLFAKYLSLNNRLSPNFCRYIQNTHNVCIYKLGYCYIPPSVTFPKAKTVTLINCNKMGVDNILKHEIFPNIENIHYLSLHPANYDIYQRFNKSVKWIFPNKNYDFYNFMELIGHGRKNSTLIDKYVLNKKVIEGDSTFDISYTFDLNIPGLGFVNNDWYKNQFYEYLLIKTKKYNNMVNNISPQEMEELHFHKEIMKNNLELELILS